VTDTWYILGAGSIGKLLACKLQRAGLAVCLLQRRGRRPAGGAIELVEGSTSTPVHLRQLETGQPGEPEISRLLITTKAGQVLPAFLDVRDSLGPDAAVVLLHNGMGTYEQLCEYWQPDQVFSGTTTEAAWQDENGRLIYAGHGETRLGQTGRAAPPAWFNAWADAEPDVSWSADIALDLWRKLLINCAINPLTAIHHCRNGELLDNSEWRQQSERVCTELAAVSRARGQSDLAETIQDQAFAVMRATATNQSSMLRDVLHGRITEIDYITGYLCSEAERLGIPCPANQQLLKQVRLLDSLAPPP
jgi:2-dehydropantoate 2-reductase